MPAWLASILTWAVKTFWPIIEKAIEKVQRKKQIDKEEDAYKEANEQARQQAIDWLRAHPGQPLPKELEDKLRDSNDRDSRV